MKAFSVLIINGKKFVPPPGDDSDFKAVFRRLMREGAGRPVDEHGISIGPWTPELLADEISKIEANKSGVDLRSVQRWFEDNDRGIKTDNIRWLAWIFGCGDPDASGKWQVELVAANSRLAARRRAKKREGESPDTPEPHSAPETDDTDSAVGDVMTVDQGTRLGLTARTEALFTEQHALTLSSLVWAGLTALAFMTFIFGVQSVTYPAAEGLDKQVGFLWAPSWTILPLVILPLYLATVIKLLAFWKDAGRPRLGAATGAEGGDTYSWAAKITSFSWLFWTITIVSFALIFLLQWSGVHLRALLHGDAAGYMMDWNIVAIVRPDVIDIPSAIVLSMLAYLYFGILMWLFFAGLVLLIATANDFHEIGTMPGPLSDEDHSRWVFDVGSRIMEGVYCCTILAILFITCIKLQSTYLLSSGETIVRWLVSDAMAALGGHETRQFGLEQRGIPQFTSLLLLFLSCLVFVICFLQVYSVIERCPVSKVVFRLKRTQWKMLAVIFLLSANLVLIGVFTGFSVLLIVSLVVATYSLYDPKVVRT